jgi:hypothetical protein
LWAARALTEHWVIKARAMNASTPPDEELFSPKPPHSCEALNSRVTRLETLFEAILPTLATKADIADLLRQMQQSRAELRSDMTKWVLGIAIAMFFGFAGLAMRLGL